MSKKKITFERIESELVELRRARDQADARLLVRLVQVERDHLGIIAEAGYASFTQFAKQFISGVRFEPFKRGLERIGEEEALRIGAPATAAAGRLTAEADEAEFIEAVSDWSATHNGTLPTSQTAQHILRQVNPRKEVPEATRRTSELHKLRAEVQRLRAENRQLRRQLAKLDKQAA